MKGLVCVRCRRLVAGEVTVAYLVPDGPLLRCGCGAVYPVLDGIPLVLRDLAGWMRSEATEALARQDLPEPVAAVLAEAEGGAWRRNRQLREVYLRSTEGPLQSRLRELGAGLTGEVLELGAGRGSLGRVDVTALDGNLGLLRDHPGRKVCADAADPPFVGGSFDAVVLANVLDSCADPGVILAQAAGLLRPGGTLVVSCAFSFQDTITPAERRFGEPTLDAALEGGSFFGHPIRTRVLAREEHDWPLQIGPRSTHLHRVRLWIAEKLPPYSTSAPST